MSKKEDLKNINKELENKTTIDVIAYFLDNFKNEVKLRCEMTQVRNFMSNEYNTLLLSTQYVLGEWTSKNMNYTFIEDLNTPIIKAANGNELDLSPNGINYQYTYTEGTDLAFYALNSNYNTKKDKSDYIRPLGN